jgi:transposase InsO family protein
MAIDQLQLQGYSVAAACQVLDVSRSAWYAWSSGESSPRQQLDHRLRLQIREIFLEHRRRYGARRIVAELAANHQPVSRRRVRRLMEEMELRAIQPRSFKPRTTDSRHALGYSPNLLLNAPPPTGINQIWVGDISYVPLQTGNFLFLALLMDLFSRRLVGWDLQNHMRQSLTMATLRLALSARQISPGLIHHSDRGGQYAGTCYRSLMGRVGMLASMSRADNCYDNAFMESCFGTLKSELEMKAYENEDQARQEIGVYIRYFNVRRRHSALGYLSPEAFEQMEQRRGR